MEPNIHKVVGMIESPKPNLRIKIPEQKDEYFELHNNYQEKNEINLFGDGVSFLTIICAFMCCSPCLSPKKIDL
jgi:hypothetical protein